MPATYADFRGRATPRSVVDAPHRPRAQRAPYRRVGSSQAAGSGTGEMRSEAPDLCTSCSPSWRCACALRPCRTSPYLRLTGRWFRTGPVADSLARHWTMPGSRWCRLIEGTSRGSAARVRSTSPPCPSRSIMRVAAPGREAGRRCSWPTRSGSAREAQSRVAADRAVRPRRRVRGRELAGCVQSCLRSREAASAGQGGFARGS